jgi:hypothetical protein
VRAGLPLAAAAALLVPAEIAKAVPAPTALTLSGPSKPVAAGAKARLTATLTAAGKPLAGKSISFVAGTAEVGTAKTDSKGRATEDVRLTAATTFTARFTPAGADAAAYAPAQSPPVSLASAAKVSVNVGSYLRAGRRAVGVPGARVRLRGSVSPYVAGATVEISVFRNSRRVLHRTVPVSNAGKGRGRYAVGFAPSRRGVHRISVSQTGASGDRTRLYVVRPSARSGFRGIGVRALQRRLKDLGYLAPVSGHYGGSTSRAVLAFRKVNGFARTTSAGRAVFRRLARGGGGFKVRYPKAGKHAEFDWSRQVLVLARGSRPQLILHTSSGTSATPTVFGNYRFYRREPGYNNKNMYYSVYFVGGYAIHGYDPVPTYPASHGCLRIPIPSAKRVYGWVSLGDPIFTYR